jgi:putative flippase GtrA
MSLPAPFDRLKSRLDRAWRERGISLKAASFAMIGVVNTLIDLAVFLLAYNGFGVPLVAANVLAWLVAVSFSYVMNSFITFAAESGSRLRLRDYGTFVASGIAGVVTNTTVLVIAAYWMPVLAAKLAAIAASFLVNFSLSHFVVFRSRDRRMETTRE